MGVNTRGGISFIPPIVRSTWTWSTTPFFPLRCALTVILRQFFVGRYDWLVTRYYACNSYGKRHSTGKSYLSVCSPCEGHMIP